MDLLHFLVPSSMLIYVCNGDFFKDLEKLDVDSQLNEIDKMFNKIDMNEAEAMETLMDGRQTKKTSTTAEDILSNMFNSDCKYECPDGSKPQVRTTHKPSYNGCGSFGITFELDDLPEMTSCCNKHDICYDSCGTVRTDCDNEFKKCLDKMCKQLKKRLSKKEHQGCKDMAKLMYTGTLALGCTPFLEGQEEACICDSELKSGEKTAGDKKTGSKRKGDTKAADTKPDIQKARYDKESEKESKTKADKESVLEDLVHTFDRDFKPTTKYTDSQTSSSHKSNKSNKKDRVPVSKMKDKDEL